MARFKIQKRDGSWSPEKNVREVMRTARLRLIPGAGPFKVVRITADGGKYPHAGLSRLRGLKVTRAILDRIGPDAALKVWNRKGKQVLHVLSIPVPVYLDPLRDCIGLRGLRQDQGVDYSVTADSPVYAIGPAIVTVYRPVSGWPLDANHSEGGAYIAYKLTEGPHKGKYVYDAEHITLDPSLKVGSNVGIHTRIATHHPGFANCEMGWALPSNDGYSPLAVAGYGGNVPQFHEGDRTAAGDSFDQFMQSLGSPAGLTEGRRIAGSVPAGYP